MQGNALWSIPILFLTEDFKNHSWDMGDPNISEPKKIILFNVLIWQMKKWGPKKRTDDLYKATELISGKIGSSSQVCWVLVQVSNKLWGNERFRGPGKDREVHILGGGNFTPGISEGTGNSYWWLWPSKIWQPLISSGQSQVTMRTK